MILLQITSNWKHPILRNIKNKGKQAGDKKDHNETVGIKMSGFDLRITLQEPHHQTLAERLFRDVENGDLYNVFGNNALKHPLVLRAFIRIMVENPTQNCTTFFFGT